LTPTDTYSATSKSKGKPMTYRITAEEDHEIDEAYSKMEAYRFQRNRLRDAIKKAIALIEAGMIIEAQEHLADTLMKNGATR